MIQLHRLRGAICLVSLGLFAAILHAQTPGQTPAPSSQTPPATQTEPVPQGIVLYQSHGDAPQPAAQQPPAKTPTPEQVPENAKPQLTDTDRAAVRITRYDLDIRIAPADSKLTGRARLTIRNASDKPLPRIPLEISSTLTWTSASVQGSVLPIEQHLLDTDADHTGQARELILTLHKPLAPGESLAIDTFYSGTIQPNGGRLERLGASPAQALQTDWDAITPDSTAPDPVALRGFGNVLWFPVAAPQLFLSDGTLVPAISHQRFDHAATPVSLRLSIEYTGEPPTAAYFCGRRQPLAALHDNADAPVAYGSGIATATFAPEPIGIRPLSLFVIAQPESMVAPLPSASGAPSSGAPPMLAVETTDDRALPLLADSAERVAPLIQQWLGPHPLTALTVIDHSGQPFEDGPLLIAPVASLAGSDSSPMLAHSLTHAWVQTGQPWIDEGLAEFFSLLWIERQHGRDTAINQLDALMQPVATADNLTDTAADTNSAATASSSSAQSSVIGQPLIAAYDELFFRRKAAAVWWMLRDIAGEQPLQLALSAWRTQPVSHDSPEQQAQAFEALLEKTSGKDLAWFFNDWVLHDRGLPALSIVDVVPRELPAGTGHDKGWLVAVTVHNAGAATADVPLVVRAGELSVTRRIRIPGLSNATERVIVQSPPTDVTVNDGSVPESGPSVHTRTVVVHQE